MLAAVFFFPILAKAAPGVSLTANGKEKSSVNFLANALY